MLRKKNLLIVTLIILLLAIPVSALAASKSNTYYTLNYPDGGECDPAEIISTTGVPADGYVAYNFYYQLPDLSLVYKGWQNMDGSTLGNLSVTYPYDWADPTAIYYAIAVAAYDGSGTYLGQLQAKWSCTPPTPPPGGEGCTPGYWRNHLDQWPPTGYSTGDFFNTVFGVNYFDPAYTLGEAINQGGGGLNVIARHGTAGLLSAAHPDVDYPYTVAEVIAFVQAGNIDPVISANEAGCPID